LLNIDTGFRKFGWISWISTFSRTPSVILSVEIVKTYCVHFAPGAHNTLQVVLQNTTPAAPAAVAVHERLLTPPEQSQDGSP